MIKMASVDREIVSNCRLLLATNHEFEIAVGICIQVNLKREFIIFKIFPKKLTWKVNLQFSKLQKKMVKMALIDCELVSNCKLFSANHESEIIVMTSIQIFKIFPKNGYIH